MNNSLFVSLFLACTATSVSAHAQGNPLAGIPEGEPWAIREIIRADVADAWWIDSITDIDNDGVLDFMVWLGPTSPENAGRLFHGGDLSLLFGKGGLYINPYYRLGNGVILASPTGYRLATYGNLGNPPTPRMYIFNPDSLVPAATIWSPPPSPGGPSHRLGSAVPAGDIDDDGYDDLFLYLHTDIGWTSVALLDGATLTYKWINDYPQPFTTGSISSHFPEPYQDVDGDGVKDIWVSFLVGGLSGDWHTRCLSGVDGHAIWTDIRTTGNGINLSRQPTLVGDLNSDGIRDIFFTANPYPQNGEPGFLRTLSGADGSLIWEVSASDFDPGANMNPVENLIYLKGAACSIHDINGDGIPDISIPTTELTDPSAAPGFIEDRMWVFSGATGDLILREQIGETSRMPWASDSNDAVLLLRPLGDIDNDGWPEYFDLNIDPLTVPGHSDFFLYGRTTLRHPDQAQEGERIDLGLHIPTGANKPFRILFSTGFDPLQSGFYAGGLWNTHLVGTPLLHASMQAPRLQGTLDAKGKRQLNVRIPNNLGLAGQTLYAVAFVHDPAKPKGILTKSSMAVIEILP